MKRRFNFEPNTAGDNAVDVSVFHQKPGYNYYSGAMESGGFYISFQPGTRKSIPGSNFESFEFTMFTSGFKVKVMDAPRNSSKKREQIINLITKEVAYKAFEGDRDWVAQFIKQIKL